MPKPDLEKGWPRKPCPRGGSCPHARGPGSGPVPMHTVRAPGRPEDVVSHQHRSVCEGLGGARGRGGWAHVEKEGLVGGRAGVAGGSSAEGAGRGPDVTRRNPGAWRPWVAGGDGRAACAKWCPLATGRTCPLRPGTWLASPTWDVPWA